MTEPRLKISETTTISDAKCRLIQFANTKTSSEIAMCIINSIK